MMKILVATADTPEWWNQLRRLSTRTRSMGYEVFEANNGYEAKRILEEVDIDLLLTDCDWVLPGMKGNEVIAWVKANKPSTKTVLMSGHPRIQQHASECGADAYIDKGLGLGSEHILKTIKDVTQT